jgi:hypothetical protein
MSEKKSSSGKKLSVSMVKKRPVVTRSAPQKPYRLSPTQDHKRRGSGCLLSRLAVHAARRDGKDGEVVQSFGSRRQWWLCCVSLERNDLSSIGTEGCDQAATGGKTKGLKKEQTDSYSFSA